jgi:phosphoribosylaminoimidazolecarboxamide formyltransferase/IMP cyclohydrolase
MLTDMTPIRRALLSVSDKRGLVEFARELRRLGVEILATGGTAAALREAEVEIVEIDAYTGFPEILEGRVKTLHPKVHAGILYRRDEPSHARVMQEHGYGGIDLVAVNLYPFEETVARPGVSWAEAVEQIDIGGPTLLRSAAKNCAHVTVVCSPDHYADIVAEMRAHGGATTPELRRRLAGETFRRTAAYDRAIAGFFARPGAAAGEARLPQLLELPELQELPERLELVLERARLLRYGENPHQRGALYGPLLDRFEQLHGRELSYNNLADLMSALELAARLGREGPSVAIIKHSNPCGAARGTSVAEAWSRALATDPQSASGGIVAASAGVDREAARAMKDHFIELLVAPEFSDSALDLLRSKKNRILLRAGPEAWRPGERGVELRSVGDSVLVQTRDLRDLRDDELRVATRRAPTGEESAALRFAWDVVRHVKSNAVVYTAADRTLGIGAGQMSRVDAARLAVLKAGQAGIDLAGCVVASDAFFPFADGLLVAADAGATAAIQPGGSIRDREVIDAADARGMAMVFTGVRHFRH